jgi:hypothetical protein
MTKDEALKMALEALEEAHHVIEHNQLLTYLRGQDAKKRRQAITAIKEALAQPEPVTHKYSLELPSGTDGEIRFAKVWWHDCKAEGDEILHRLCISVEEPVQDKALCCGEYQTCKKDCNRRRVYQALKPV